MSESTMLIAYEINGSKAKDLIVRNAGFVGRLKKFQNRKLVDHVSSAWQSLEAIFRQNGHEFQNKLLYTTKDTNSLSIGTTYSDLINNSYIMSLLAEKDVSNQRYFSFQDESEFEKQQFSLILDQAGTTLNEQEIGVFGWFMCPEDQVDRLLKQVAVSFSGSYGGELHFFEFTNSGKIYPNFSDVSSQRFEGKLAGNYQMVLNASEYNKGIEALNDITLAVFRTPVLGVKPEPEQKQQPEKKRPKVNKSKKTYSNEFKDEVAKAALKDGKTLAAVGEKYGVHPTLVRTWKIKFEEQESEKMELKKADKEILNNKEENQELGVLISSLNDFRLEGHIDHDKDLSVRVIFEENEKFSSELLVLQGKATLSSNKKTLDADVFESFNLDGYNGPNAGYLKLEENCEPEFSINLKAEVYRLEKYQVIEIDTSDKNALKGIELSELNNFKIDKFKITFDDDNDIEVKGEIVLKDSNVYAISLETEAPDEDPYHNPEMAEDGKAELDQGLWGTKKGATIYLVAAQFEKISDEVSLEGSGVAEISEPLEEEEEDFFDNDDSDEKLYVNIASISVEEVVMEIDENGYATSKDLIFAKISGFMTGIVENVDSEARFFLHTSDKIVHEIHVDDELNEFFDSKKSGKFENIVHENDYLKLAFTAHGANHWDDGFLSTSAAGVGNVNIWGFYPSIGEHAVQGYWDGNFDTGIAADPDDDANYTGDERMSFFGIQENDFDLETYGLNESYPPEIEDETTLPGAVGVFEFQIKRGLVDEDEIEDDEIEELVEELKNLCDNGKHEEACELLLPNLSFEFDPGQLDDDPEQFFSDTDYIEIECTDSNTTVKVGNDDGLVVTISVKFEIPLNEDISTRELAAYLPESGAWSAASVSPGWGYAGSDGDNVWFVGLKSDVSNIGDISSQTPGTDEFKIEVASACAESNENYVEFAKKYNLDPQQLNLWATNFLGKNLEDTNISPKSLKFFIDLRNADSGHSHDLELEFEQVSQSIYSRFSPNKSVEHWKELFFELFDNAEMGETSSEGLLYKKTLQVVTKTAFDKLGWHDVTLQFTGVEVNGNKIALTEADEDIFADYLGIQLVREDKIMYFIG